MLSVYVLTFSLSLSLSRTLKLVNFVVVALTVLRMITVNYNLKKNMKNSFPRFELLKSIRLMWRREVIPMTFLLLHPATIRIMFNVLIVVVNLARVQLKDIFQNVLI